MMLSKNGAALAVLLVEAIMSSLGIEFEPGTVARAVEGSMLAIALCAMIWHQIMERTDVKAFLFKH